MPTVWTSGRSGRVRSVCELIRLATARVVKRPARPALGLRPRDKYWLHVFDALAIAAVAHVRNEQGDEPPDQLDSKLAGK